MKDYIVRGMAAKNQVRFFACSGTETVEKARATHHTSPVVTNALGRFLMGAGLMGAMCKNDTDKLSLKIDCNGPVRGMLATANSKGEVKGYVAEPEVMLPAKDVIQAIDLGVMSVIKDLGLKEPYVGQTHLISGGIAEDLTYYFVTSEQIPSSVSLGVLLNEQDTSVKVAGGFIIQMMPFADDALIDVLEERIKELSFTKLLEAGKSVEEIIEILFKDYDVSYTDKIPFAYVCDCSKDRVEQAVLSVGRKELAKMIEDDEPIEVVCDFCRTKYTFSPEELLSMITTKSSHK